MSITRVTDYLKFIRRWLDSGYISKVKPLKASRRRENVWRKRKNKREEEKKKGIKEEESFLRAWWIEVNREWTVRKCNAFRNNDLIFIYIYKYKWKYNFSKMEFFKRETRAYLFKHELQSFLITILVSQRIWELLSSKGKVHMSTGNYANRAVIMLTLSEGRKIEQRRNFVTRIIHRLSSRVKYKSVSLV